MGSVAWEQWYLVGANVWVRALCQLQNEIIHRADSPHFHAFFLRALSRGRDYIRCFQSTRVTATKTTLGAFTFERRTVETARGLDCTTGAFTLDISVLEMPFSMFRRKLLSISLKKLIFSLSAASLSSRSSSDASSRGFVHVCQRHTI